jgi:hypothetical protein
MSRENTWPGRRSIVTSTLKSGAVRSMRDEPRLTHSKKTGRDGVSFFGLDETLVRAGTGATIRPIEWRRE